MEESNLDILEASNTSDDDTESMDNDPPLIGVDRDTILVEKMSKLVSKYVVPSSYICRIPIVSEYVSTLGP